MATTDNDFDYETWTRENSPDWNRATRGPEAREERRRKASKRKVTIRLDDEVVERFKALVPGGQGYQTLINQALREWLEAQSVERLLRDELPHLVHEALRKDDPQEEASVSDA